MESPPETAGFLLYGFPATGVTPANAGVQL
jgi:hypothetical protein